MNNGVNRSIFFETGAIFEPASWLIKIDFINQFILNNNVLISVLGDAGSGKTTFAHLLQDKLDSNVISEMLTIQPLFDQTELLSQLGELLALEGASSIAEIVRQIVQRESRVLLLIDNAERLPESFLKELLDALKEQEGSGTFHVCLLSDFSLVKVTSRLAREAYKDMIHSIELQPLSESETRAYVMERMAAAPSGKVDISDEWLHEFYQLTEGNIVGINTQMVGFFSKKPGQSKAFYKAFLPYGPIPFLVLAVIGVGYWLYSQAPSDVPQLERFVKNSIESIQIELPLLSEIPSYQVAAIHQPMQMVSLQKAEFQVSTDDGDDANDDSLVVMDKVVSIPKVVMPSTETNAHHSTVVAKKESIHGGSKTQVSSGQYTIQLLASRDKSELNRLAKQFSASGNIKVLHFNNHGVTWYVLTQGEYPQQQLAKNAIATLPKELAQFKPWVRSTSNLKSLG